LDRGDDRRDRDFEHQAYEDRDRERESRRNRDREYDRRQAPERRPRERSSSPLQDGGDDRERKDEVTVDAKNDFALSAEVRARERMFQVEPEMTGEVRGRRDD
jgi:hypothetical protein